MKIRLTEYNEQTKIDLDAVPPVVPHTVPHTVPPVEKGRFDSLQEMYPEDIKLRLRRGAKDYLKQESRSRGFSSVSTMIRSAIKYAIKHPEFVNGWDK